MEVLLADEFGFCFGVERAVEMVEEAVEELLCLQQTTLVLARKFGPATTLATEHDLHFQDCSEREDT